MTYVPTTIRISTHGVDFFHQGLEFGKRTQNRQWGCRKVSRGEGRKKEKEEEEREREGSHILPVSRVMVVDATPSWVALYNMVRLDQRPMKHVWQSRQTTNWRDSSRCGATSAPGHAHAPRGQIFEIRFDQIQILLKKLPKKKIASCPGPGMAVTEAAIDVSEMKKLIQFPRFHFIL
jgi:hypothetical protein